MMRNKGIAFRLSISILISSTVIFLFIFGYNYITSRRMLLKNINANARHLALASVHKIESELRAVQKIPLNLGNVLENTNPDKKELETMLTAIVRDNPEIYGAAIAFQPFAFDSGTRYYAPYGCKCRDSVCLMNDTEDSARFYYEDWYQIPYMLNRPIWSEPYFDEGGGNIVMCSYSAPFYKKIDGKRHIAGIVTADIDLSWLQKIVSSIKIARTGYGFLISKNGTIVTHPDNKLIMNETIFSVAEAETDKHLRNIGRAMIKGESGFVQTKSLHSKQDCWMVYVPLVSSGWSLGVLFPKNELMADVTALNRKVLVLGAVCFCILLLVIITIAGTITKPLRLLVKTTEQIAEGNFDSSIPAVVTGDETGRLAQSFATMQDSLKKHIRQLTEATAAKERIESELKIAHDIQTNMLPRIYPPFPDRKEIDLFAMIQPAREVGGDFFDFFFVDKCNLFFYVADVAGKGVPASLFMAVARTLIKTKSTSGLKPQDVLARVNDDLCMDNDACMFVTLFCGMLDVRSGRMIYVNGGHNPPLLYRTGGSFEFLDVHRGIALGVMHGVSFIPQSVTLGKGDVIFLYTDGVNEALNRKKELFGTERLKTALDKGGAAKTTELIQCVYNAITEFTEGEEQSDDITMLALKHSEICCQEDEPV